MSVQSTREASGRVRDNLVWPSAVRRVLSSTILEDYASERLLFQRGRHLAVEGAPNPFVFFHLTGWACAECVSARGDRVLMDFLTAGDFSGLAQEGGDAAYTVTAMSDLVALRFERELLYELVDRDERVRATCFQAMQASLNRTRNMRVAVSAKSGVSKVCQVLSDLGERVIALSDSTLGAVVRPRIPLSQVALANAIGLTPVAVNRIVKTLRQAGLVDWDVAGLSILDLRRLRAFA